MGNLSYASICDLIGEANSVGVKVLLNSNRLVVKFRKGSSPESGLLDKLKLHRNEIEEFLQESSTDEVTIGNTVPDVQVSNGRSYYEITPVQNYWVDSSLDEAYKKNESIHGVVLVTFDIDGELHWEIFKKAVHALIDRHECLRGIFCEVNGQYLMGFIDAQSGDGQFEMKSVRAGTKGAQKTITDFINFSGHSFDLEKGPLFLVRLLRISKTKFILSIKTHHVIYDGWSGDILQRDLSVFYYSFLNNITPDLPSMTYQLKEYMAFQNRYTGVNLKHHKNYWMSLYKTFPPEIGIPGSNNRDSRMEEKIAGREKFQVKQAVTERLIALAGSHKASVFVVLQASFSSYFYCCTGQNDLTVGTYVLGRDVAGSENQLGCFANTKIIRTVLDAAGDFDDAIEKVKKSNEDMLAYTAYPLMRLFEEMRYGTGNPGETFWKINLQYVDIANILVNDKFTYSLGNGLPGVKVTQRPDIPNSITPIDLHVWFYGSGALLEVEVEYDSSRYSGDSIRTLFGGYLEFLDHIDGSMPVRPAVSESKMPEA